MAFSRKFLKALGIEDDKVETIMEEHTTVTEALKMARDTYKEGAEKLEAVQKQLDEAQKKNGTGEDYKAKYEALVAENQKKEARTAKKSAYTALLKEIGVGETFLDLIVKANTNEIDGLEMDGDKVKDADKLKEALQTSMKPYISAKQVHGHKVENPPANGGARKTREEIMAIKDTAERQQAMAENMDLFQ